MSGICDTCKIKSRCISPEGGLLACPLYEQDRKNRWFELFGTPERAMRTIALIGDMYPCDDGCDPSGEKCKVCPFADAPSCRIDRDHPEESPLLEWLRGDA